MSKFGEAAGDFIDQYGTGLVSAATIAGALNSAGDVRDMGYGVQNHLTQLGGTLQSDSAFKGYGVSSGLGSSAVGADGGINLGVNSDNNMLSSGYQNMAGAGNAFTAALGQNGGQSTADWSQAGMDQLGLSRGIDPSSGQFSGQGNQLFSDAMGMNPNTGWAGATAQDAAQRSMADPSRRQAEIFDQLMAIQNPELARATAQQQAREHAMGRGGVAGSAYGGTAEDAAMAKARAQANSQAAVSAMQQADAERSMFGQMASQYGQLGNQNYANQSNQMSSLLNAASQQGQLGNQYYSTLADRENALANSAAQFGQLGNTADANAIQQGGMLSQIGSAMGQLGIDQNKLAYLPMEMQMKLLELSEITGSMSQTGQLTGNDYLAQLLLGGVDANVNAQKVSSELTGNLYNALLNNMGGSQSADGSGVTGLLGLAGDLVREFL